MKKIRLEMDALRVDSFATAAAPEARGTVHGRQIDPIAQAAEYSSCSPEGCSCDNCAGDGGFFVQAAIG